MPGNDLTASRALIPSASDTRAVARANLTTLLTNILDDIEPSVTAAQININSNLSFLSGGTKYAATDVAYVGFEDRATDTSQVESAYTKSGELYYHDGAGNKVQLTSGGSAVAGSSGDITGTGYGAASVEINWHAGTKEYRFKTGSGTEDLADVIVDRVRFLEASGTDYATLGAQAAMSGTVAFSLPIALPAGTYLMTMDASGNMGHTTTPSVSTLTTSGTVTATGDISGADITASGEFKHGDMIMNLDISSGISLDSTDNTRDAFVVTSGGVSSWTAVGAGDVLAIPIPLKEGDRIKSLRWYIDGYTGGTKTMKFVGLVGSTVNYWETVNNTSSSLQQVATTVSPQKTMGAAGAGETWHATFTAVASNDAVYGLSITYDRP